MTDEASGTRPASRPNTRPVRRFRIEVVAGPALGTRWGEPHERCGIGSHPSNDLVLDDPTVSRFHCELSIAGDQVRARDLGSRNGTVINAVTVVEGLFSSGVVIALGDSQLRVTIDSAHREVVGLERDHFGTLVGSSLLMRELFSQLERVAPSDTTVLIEGETGTGKEGVAEAIHQSSRRGGNFVAVDCGAIPSNLIESELFGHEVGAFTGAARRRIGAFEESSGGTLFLDEIGELPLELQPKLLRAIESREIRRVGGVTPIKCKLRIVAATNRDLRAEVNRAAFRADLYYRLAVVRITLPPLRSRLEDLPLLVDRLLRRIGASEATITQLTAPDFIAELAAASWPGNVRELRNHLEQCVVFDEQRSPRGWSPPHPTTVVDPALPYEVARRQVIDAFERDYVVALLARCNDNVAQAARESGLSRTYLHRMLRRHGLR